jgi:hypothetical protein
MCINMGLSYLGNPFVEVRHRGVDPEVGGLDEDLPLVLQQVLLLGKGGRDGNGAGQLRHLKFEISIYKT